MSDGLKAARYELSSFIRENKALGSGSLYELVANVDPENLYFLGRTDTEPGDLLTFEFRASGSTGRTFIVLVAADCSAEVAWHE